jgi:predicted alpha/beta hydrolase family esterase
MTGRRQILLIHSAGPQGSRQGSGYLVSTLRRALGKEYELRYPRMPDPDRPAYEPWAAEVERELAALEDGAILMGHSVGGSVLLKHLARKKPPSRRFAGVVLVATPFWGSSGWKLREFALPAGFASRLPKTRMFLYHSRDDDVVPFAHLALFARRLSRATVRPVDGYGHLFGKRCGQMVDDLRSL